MFEAISTLTVIEIKKQKTTYRGLYFFNTAGITSKLVKKQNQYAQYTCN